MRELRTAAVAGRGAVALVEGAAGIGKTSLLQRVVADASEAGCAVAVARGSELERGFAFGLVRQLFEPLLATLDADGRAEALAGAARLALPVLEVAEVPGAGTRGGDVSEAALHGLHWVTANLARRRPLVLAADDAHWADAPSLRFLAYLANRVDGLPVLLVAGARPAEPGAEHDLLDELAAAPAATVLRPAPLSAAAVGELVAQAFSRPVDAGFCAACEAATKGNPLLLRELLATLAVEGIAPEAAQAGAVAQVAPPSVARSVARRLGRLPDPAGRLARATAILGSGARHRTAARLAGLDADAAQRAAGALAGAGILDAATLEFVHPLVRAAVLGDLAAPERARAHRDAAALLHRDGAPGDEVALQLLAAEPAGEGWAVDVLRGAAAAPLRVARPTWRPRTCAAPWPSRRRSATAGACWSSSARRRRPPPTRPGSRTSRRRPSSSPTRGRAPRSPCSSVAPTSPGCSSCPRRRRSSARSTSSVAATTTCAAGSRASCSPSA